jgi:hypothetical protein
MEIMSPHYKSIRDGNTIAIPEEYRGEKYDPPSFRMSNRQKGKLQFISNSRNQRNP